MSKPANWTIDVNSLDEHEIVRLLRELKGNENVEVVQSLKRELVARARREGATNNQIIRVLAQNVARGLSLHEVAKEWADVFGITVKEFKRIADAK